MKVSIIGLFYPEQFEYFPTSQVYKRVGVLEVSDLEEDLLQKIDEWAHFHICAFQRVGAQTFLGSISHCILPESTES